MGLLRRYKISILTNQPLTGIDKEIIDYINKNISNLTIFILDEYKFDESIFYMNSYGKYILEYDKNWDCLWLIKEFYDVLNLKYNLSETEIVDIIKLLIKPIVSKKFNTINSATGEIISYIEDKYYENVINKKNVSIRTIQ